MQKIHMKQNINKREKVGLKHYDDRKDFMEYSSYMQDVYKNIKNIIQEKNVKY